MILKKVYIATTNTGKFKEIEHYIMDSAEIVLKIPSEIVPPDENGLSFQENAFIKARYYSEILGGEAVIADDSGIEIEYLDNMPGVLSARYADNDKDKIEKVRQELKIRGLENSPALFTSSIVFLDRNIEQVFHGVVQGTIQFPPKGTNGFGYDPIFIPHGYNETFAEMKLETKNKISHRAIALSKLNEYLKTKL